MEISEKLVKAISRFSLNKPIKIVAICGAADLGKTYLAKKMVADFESLGMASAHLAMDSYLMPRPQRISLGMSGYNSNAYSLSTLSEDLRKFIDGMPIEVNEYNHAKGGFDGVNSTIANCSLLLLEGLHAMHPSILEFVDFSIFIQTNDKLLNEIRHQADIVKRKQSVAFSLGHLEQELKAYNDNVKAYKSKADSCLELVRKWEYIEQL